MADLQDGCKVFIIDDELDVRERLSSMLKRRGYSVTTANDGREGYQRVVENKVDVIICDVYMPDMNGVEFLTKIRGINVESEVIMMTGYPSNELLEMTNDKNVADFLVKPFTVTDIINSLTKAQSRIQDKDL